MWKPAADYQVGTTGTTDQRVTLDALADPAFRITADPDLTPGDIVAWEGDAEIFSDGSFATMGNFSVSVDFATWGEQTMAEPEPPPVVEPEPEPEPEPQPVKQKGPPKGKGWRK